MPTLKILPDGSVLASGDQTKRDVFRLTFDNPLPRVTALRIEALPDESLPKRGPGRIAYEGPFGDFFLSEVALRVAGNLAPFSGASQSFAGGKDTAARAIDGDPQTGWSINGGQGQAHTAVFTLATPLTGASIIDLELLFEKYYAAGLGRFRVWVTDDDRPVAARGLPSDVEAILVVPEAERSADNRARLMAHFLSITPELSAARDAIRKLRDQMPAFVTSLVLTERPCENPRRTSIHRRGEFLQPTDPVEPELPSIFAPLPPDAPHNRLALAQWLVSERNPLVGRVTVNRQWATLFGRALVRTTEDFGYQGEPPTHPELLDWLAVQFQRDGWSLKKLHKLIMTSATYRQSSRASADLLAKDPQNKLLARARGCAGCRTGARCALCRHRGLLSAKIGGPSVFPPQPPNVSSEGAYGALNWTVSEGEDRYRRGLYTFTKRTAPYAMLSAFDAPSGEACLARREVSNTPLQSLALLNDTVFVEAAQALGKQLTAEKRSVDATLDDFAAASAGRRAMPNATCSSRSTRCIASGWRKESSTRPRSPDRGTATADTIERAWTLTARARDESRRDDYQGVTHAPQTRRTQGPRSREQAAARWHRYRSGRTVAAHVLAREWRRAWARSRWRRYLPEPSTDPSAQVRTPRRPNLLMSLAARTDTLRRGPNPSSTYSWPARRVIWICSTTSRRWPSTRANRSRPK